MGTGCERKLVLKKFKSNDNGETVKKMFFLETSGRSWLTPREACCLESASRMSNLQVTVILTSSFFSLQDNSSCYIYQSYPNIQFYTIDVKDTFKHTPLETILEKREFMTSQYQAVHLSDMLRLAIVYKYGGFYSDFDAMTLKDLSQFQNVIGGTNIQEAILKNLERLKDFSEIIGVENIQKMSLRILQNTVFQFEKNHKILAKTMEEISKRFEGHHRIEIGPLFLTTVVKNMYNISEVEHFKKKDLEVLPNDYFYPAKAYEISKLWTKVPKTKEDWKQMFQNSFMVHFWASQTNSLVVNGNSEREAYSYLGPIYCPVSIVSSNSF